MTFGNPPSSECVVEDGGEGEAGTAIFSVLDCDLGLSWLGDRGVEGNVEYDDGVRCPSRIQVSDMYRSWGIVSGASTVQEPKSNLLLSMFP